MNKRSLIVVLLTLSSLLLCSPTVTHAQWEPDVRLTVAPDSSCTGYNNAWSIAASGDSVHVVWFDKRDGDGEIYYKASTDRGTTWTADTRLTNDMAFSGWPAIHLSGLQINVAWEDQRELNPEIFYMRSTNGGATWEPFSRLSYAYGVSTSPCLSMTDSIVHVVWSDDRSGNSEIWYRRSLDGGAYWEPDTSLTNAPGNSEFPSIGVSGTNLHVAWADYRQGNTAEIYYKRSTDRGTTWGPDIRLTNYDSVNSYYPSLAVRDSDVHIVWRNDQRRLGIYYIRSTDGGDSWSPASRITDTLGYTFRPSIAVLGSNVHLVWMDDRLNCNPYFDIYYKCSTNRGNLWGPDTRLTYDPSFSWYPSIAVSGTKVHVVWTDHRDGNYEVYYKRNPTGNPSSIEEKAEALGQRVDVMHKLVPNPFVSFATIPGHHSELFILYDISGHRVGTYRGERIGEGLKAGVYFLRAEGGGAKPVRIVKVR
jgi:hypothetical protein